VHSHHPRQRRNGPSVLSSTPKWQRIDLEKCNFQNFRSSVILIIIIIII